MMRAKSIAAALIVTTALGLGGNALGASPRSAAQAAAKVPGLGGITGLTSGEIARWKRLIQEAHQEGQLVVETSHQAQEQSYFNKFGAEFGINVTLLTGSPTQISSRILAERNQGVYAEDVAMAGGGAMMRLLGANSFQPIRSNFVLPQVLDRSNGWFYNKVPYCDIDPAQQFCTYITLTAAANVVVFYYNTQLVTAQDLAKIKSWNDLLNPKWRGKVVMQNVAQGINASDRQTGWALLGQKYWSKFMSVLQPTVLDTGGDIAAVNGLARGQWAFAFYEGDSSPYILAQSQGLPVAIFPKILKPGALPNFGQRIALLSQSPHQAAAELYLNWALTPEGQTDWNKYNAAQGDVALNKSVPRGGIDRLTWQTTLHLKKVYIAQNHTADINTSLAWWTQEMTSLGVH